MQKIVFNAHYLMYFDTAIAEYWRALALPYEEAMHLLDGDLYVKKAILEYSGSARFDDQLSIGLKCVRIGRSSIEFCGAVFRQQTMLVKTELIYVFADPSTQTSQPVPQALRDMLNGYEAGDNGYAIQVGTWAELGTGAAQLRVEVFVNEQGVPLEMECDTADVDAIHAVASNRLGQVLATGRLLAPALGVGKIGRMAVKRVMRGSGLGRDMLEVLCNASARRGDQEVVLNAQRSAEGFYRKAGFICRGEPFDEAGIPHIAMSKQLT
jgi:YbgC/YbaW family acyl-CoA thioester hydrolase